MKKGFGGLAERLSIHLFNRSAHSAGPGQYHHGCGQKAKPTPTPAQWASKGHFNVMRETSGGQLWVIWVHLAVMWVHLRVIWWSLGPI